jgi:site-specific DNA recombinase
VGWPERISTTTKRGTRAMSKRASTYARVSYDDRKNEARNLEGQIEDGRAYCQEKGYRIVAELAEDDRGASGAEWDLPKLNQALDMARAGEFDVLVVRELDRFARSLAKQLVIEGEFKRHGVEVEYILAKYDDTPEGRLNKHIRATIAEFEREKIAQRMTRGRRNVVKSGKVMLHGDKPPYGYRVEDGALVIYEPEARIIRLVFQWYVYGDGNGKKWGIRAIANRLTGMKVPTWADTHSIIKKTRRQGEWNHSAVARILANEVYIGVWHYGKTTNSRENWLAVEVPAIIGCETWEAARKQREHNKEIASRRTKNEYLLRRRVTCQCGTKMSGRASPYKDKNYLYYCCPATSGRIAGCQCDTKYFNADQVDRAVWKWVKSWLSNPEALRHGLKEQQADQELANKPLWDRLAVIDDLLTDNRRQLEKLLDLYLSGDFDKEMLTDRKNRYETMITALEKERADLVTTLEASTLTDDQIATITDFAGEVAGGLEEAETDFDARRHIIDLLDVQVRLVIEDELRVAYARCLMSGEEERRLSFESTAFCIS